MITPRITLVESLDREISVDVSKPSGCACDAVIELTEATCRTLIGRSARITRGRKGSVLHLTTVKHEPLVEGVNDKHQVLY